MDNRKLVTTDYKPGNSTTNDSRNLKASQFFLVSNDFL